jgi:hypothetical protein
MSNGHARRAQPPSPGAAGWRRWLWVAVPFATVAPIAGYALWFAATDNSMDGAPAQIEDVIRHMQFQPLLPPNRLRGPGAIYAVVEGGSYWKVCDADPELLRDKVRSSPVPNQTRSRLEKAGFSVGSDVIDTLNAKLGTAQIVSIEYRMSNVSISEIAMRDLYLIQKKLLEDQNCDAMVGALLKQNKKVCPGYAVLTASTSYKVNYDKSASSTSATQMPIAEAVQRQIELETKGEIKLTGTHELVGQDLFYGIQLSPVCLTPDTATVPSRLDDARQPPSAHAAPRTAPPGA